MSPELGLVLVMLFMLAVLTVWHYIEVAYRAIRSVRRRARLWDRYAAVVGGEVKAIEVLNLAELIVPTVDYLEAPHAFDSRVSARDLRSGEVAGTVERPTLQPAEVPRRELADVIRLTDFRRRQAD